VILYRLVSGLATITLVTTGSIIALSTSAEARPERLIAICENRACLLVLHAATDTDGDGVTDVDERRLGSDPFDATSHPPARHVLDQVLNRGLPSFEQHLTEVVVLPQLASGRDQITTMLGAFPVGRHANVMPTVGEALMRLYDNGFDFGPGMQIDLSSSSPDSIGGYELSQWRGPDRMALVGEGAVGINSLGPNKNKDVASITPGNSINETTDEFLYDGNSTAHARSLNYTDGTRDLMTSYTTKSGGTVDVVGICISYDADGNVTGKTSDEYHRTTDGKGTWSSTERVTTNTYDKDGKVTSSTTTTTTVVIADGTMTTTVQTETTQDGKTTTSPPVTTVVKCETDCKKEANGGTKMVNPDYVSSGPITDEDAARVVARINSVRTPGPDTGDVDPAAKPVPRGNWPMVALLNPNGVTVLAVSGPPRYNSTRPDYDPNLAEMSGISGQPVPQNGPDGPIWPS
jgi:hypothetical protein